MTSETDTWVFNIGSTNWDICADGPTDESTHPKEYLGQSCHGIRAKAHSDPNGLEEGDLAIVRESGSGVRGVWRYQNKQDISGVEQELWADDDYDWVLYCEPLDRKFDEVYSEDWDALGEAIDAKPQSAQSHIRGAVSNLSQALKKEYLTQLLSNVPLSQQAGDALVAALDEMDSSPDILEIGDLADSAPYYWVNQTKKKEHIEQEILRAPISTGDFSHDVARANVGETVFHYSGGELIGHSTITETAQPVWDAEEPNQEKKVKSLVKVDFSRFEEPLAFGEVFEYLSRDEVRVEKYPIHDSGLNSGYLFNLSREAGEYLHEQGTDWEPHPLVSAFNSGDDPSLYLCRANPSDYLTILRRGAIMLWGDKKSQWNRVSPGDVVLFLVKGTEDRAKASAEHIPKGIIGGAVISGLTTKEGRWWYNEDDGRVFPYLLEFEECFVTSHMSQMNTDRPAFTLSESEREEEYISLTNGILPHADAQDVSKQVRGNELPANQTFASFRASVEVAAETLESLVEKIRPRLSRYTPSDELPGMLPHPDNDDELPDELPRRLGKIRQLIFYGPPGTGKTYTATQLAKEWVYEQTDRPSADQVRTVTFHPSFSYEDFVEGLTATKSDTDDAVTYEYESGAFLRIYQDALDAYERTDDEAAPRYVLIIDEINRGDIPQILGELITLLESDKRLGESDETSVGSAHSGTEMTLPPNLYIIGTMNTADQSISLIDAAIRRRFSFHAFPPEPRMVAEKSNELDREDIEDVAKTADPDFHPLLARSILALSKLNEKIVDGDPGRGQRLGHTYLMGVSDLEELCDAWKFELLPLLEEYYFGDTRRLRMDLLDDADGNVAPALFDSETGEVNTEISASELHASLGEIAEIEISEEKGPTNPVED